MRPFPIFIILFLTVPLLEIYLLVKVGQSAGAFNTVLLVVLTAIAGVFLLRQQGLSTLGRFQKHMTAGQLPGQEIIEGFVLLIGGVLLLVPGFFTDAIGFLCLFPLTRYWLTRWFMTNSRLTAQGHSYGGFNTPDDNVYEGEYNRQPDKRLDSQG